MKTAKGTGTGAVASGTAAAGTAAAALAEGGSGGVAEVNAETIKTKLGGMDEGHTAEAYIALISDAEMARFAPMESKPQRQTYDEASAIISRIEHQLRT